MLQPLRSLEFLRSGRFFGRSRRVDVDKPVEKSTSFARMPPDESLENNANEVLPASAGCAGLCFRPWPCAECSKGLTPTGYLFGRIEAGAITLRGSQDEVIAAQRDELLA